MITNNKFKQLNNIIFIIIISVIGLTGCNRTASNNASEPPPGNDNSIKYEYTDEGIIKPDIAEMVIKEISDKAIKAIRDKDVKALSAIIHTKKGVRFTPYTYISVDNDVVFNSENIVGFFDDQKKYTWGNYDGIGDEIILTPGEYYERFIYTQDFVNAEKVGYNTVLSFGNALENQFKVYEDPIIVEYYFSGFNPEFEGMDWRSLRLVFERHNNTWMLSGIIHNQWTI